MSAKKGHTEDDVLVRSHCETTARELWSLRDAASDRWYEIAEAMYPIARSGIASSVSANGTNGTRERLRATNKAQDLLKKGASGFAMHLTTPARQWFELGPTFKLAPFVDHRVSLGLEALTDGMRRVFESSGIYAQLNKLYEHLVAFGTGCMLLFANDAAKGYDIVSATTLRFGTYALGIDANGRVNRVVRRFEFTLNQLVESFGTGTISPELKDAYDKGHGATVRVTVVNLIEPNKVGDVFDPVAKLCDSAVREDCEYRSIYWTESYGTTDAAARQQTVSGKNHSPLLAVKGILFNPIIAPRLEREAGDVWGRGRGIDALATARELEQVIEDKMTIGSNASNPALAVDDSFQGRELSLGRGGLNFGNMERQPTAAMVPVPHNTAILDGLTNELAQELAETFFVTRFSIIDSLKNAVGDKKTATEINQLVRENMGLLGPVVTNLDSELLDPLVYTVMKHAITAAQRLGFDLSAIEPVMGEGATKVRYVGEIHQAMKSANINAIERSLLFAGQVVQVMGDPSPVDNLDADAIVRDYCDAMGLDPSDLKDPTEVERSRTSRAQMQQQMMQMQQMAEGAKAAKDGASAAVALKQSGVL